MAAAGISVVKNFPFACWYNIRNPQEEIVFAEQIRQFALFVRTQIKNKEPKEVIQSAWRNFNLRCHLFDYMVQCQEAGLLDVDKTYPAEGPHLDAAV